MQDKVRDTGDTTLPMADRDAAHLPGHWLLARLGKRVLRPGGRELTEQMLTDAELTGVDVLELAPPGCEGCAVPSASTGRTSRRSR